MLKICSGPLIFLAFVCACAVPRFGTAESSAGITVGVSIVLSGPWASWGTPIREGLELGAEDSHNHIALQFQDDRCEARQALSAFNKFLSVDNLSILILGCMENIEATLPLAESKGAVVFTMGGMSKEYLAKYPHLVSLYSLVDAEAYFLIPYLKEHANVKSVSIINHSATYGEYLGKGFEDLAKKNGIAVLSRDSVAHDTSDFHSVALRAMRGNPDAIFVHISAEKEGILIRQLRESGYKGSIYATFSFESPDVKAGGGNALEGTRYTSAARRDETEKRYTDFAKRYRERFKHDPEPTAAIAYDAIAVIDRAIDKCGAKDRDCIAAYVTTIGEFKGLGGNVLFGADRSALRPYGLKEYKDGEYRWLVDELPAAK